MQEFIDEGLVWDSDGHKYIVGNARLYIFRLFEAGYDALAATFMRQEGVTMEQMIKYHPDEDDTI